MQMIIKFQVFKYVHFRCVEEANHGGILNYSENGRKEETLLFDNVEDRTHDIQRAR